MYRLMEFMKMREEDARCRNCKYYEHWVGSCFNSLSEHRGDIIDEDDICDAYERRDKRDDSIL